MELLKLVSENEDYYLRSDSPCTGIYFNPGASDPSYIEFSNENLNQKFEFESGATSSEVFVLFYSNINAENMTELQGSLTRVVPEGRLLETDYSGSTLYISAKEMDDEYNTSDILEWYWILLIVLAALLLLILLIFLIMCCCCGKVDEEDKGSIRTDASSTSLYKDTFAEPVKGKLSDGKVKQYYTEDITPKSGFTNDL